MLRDPVLSYVTLYTQSRLRLSPITAYLEVKIWSQLKHENLTTGNKILWKRRELDPKVSPLFHNIFKLSLTSGVKLHIYLCNMVVRLFCFSQFCKSDMSRYGYLEVFHSPLDFEITTVLFRYPNIPFFSMLSSILRIRILCVFPRYCGVLSLGCRSTK